VERMGLGVVFSIFSGIMFASGGCCGGGVREGGGGGGELPC